MRWRKNTMDANHLHIHWFNHNNMVSSSNGTCIYSNKYVTRRHVNSSKRGVAGTTCNLFKQKVSRWGRRNRWLKPVSLPYCFCSAIKSFWLCFSLPQVQIANMTRGQISAREKGVEQLFQWAAVASAGVQADDVFTWKRAGNHPAPKWIISAIITGLKMNLCAALSHSPIKNNRCWKCLEGTVIKDYFVILGLLEAQLSCVLSCHERLGPCGGSFSSGLAVLGAGHLTESERCLIWECEASLSFLDTPCPHNLQLHAVIFCRVL